jgi:hypothetical protein
MEETDQRVLLVLIRLEQLAAHLLLEHLFLAPGALAAVRAQHQRELQLAFIRQERSPHRLTVQPVVLAHQVVAHFRVAAAVVLATLVVAVVAVGRAVALAALAGSHLTQITVLMALLMAVLGGPVDQIQVVHLAALGGAVAAVGAVVAVAALAL